MEQIQNKAQLSLNMIVAETEPIEIVQRALDSIIQYVDDAYIAITYKDKKPVKSHPLVKLLEEYKVNILYFKWVKNFAKARQFVLDNTPRIKNSYVIWIDADDVFANGDKLHDIADEMIKYKQSAIYFDYWYQVDLNDEGDVREILVIHKRERIIKNDNTWKWIGALHETLIEQKQENILKHFRPDCHVIHLTNGQRLDHNIDRNIEILENTVRDTQRKDPRPIIYLAKAYFDKCKMTEMPQRKIFIDLAVTLFHEYLEGSGTPGEAGYQEPSGWREERSTAWAYIAEIAILSGHPEVAIQAYQSAIDECPYFPNYYVDMALCYIMIKEYKRARHWLNIATSMPEPETTIIQFPRELKTRALEASFQCNLYEGKLDWAVEDAEKLVNILPKDEDAKLRLQEIKKIWEYNKASQSIVYLGKYLEAVGERDKLPHLVQAIPSEIVKEKFAAEMRHLFMPAKIWASNEITILCGPGFEKWSPDSIKTGLGGSEEAVVYLSQELTKLGWKVTVYANPERPGNYDGVEYKTWHDINARDIFNVLVLWRGIGFIDINPRAKYTMVWMHDVPNNPDFTEERVEKIDKIAVLSEFHKSLLRIQKDGVFEKFPENKVFLTSNGVPTQSVPEVERDPKRIIYASSPDRGLYYLLGMWPKIKEKVNDAELHVYYGWNTYDAIHGNNPARVKWKNQVLAMMKQDGIVNHGRVGHDELAEAYARAGIWVYPTSFEEISCISAMKAQKFGAIPVCTNYAALTETVKNGLKVDVDITDPEGREEYCNALIDLLQDEKKQNEIRKPMMKWANDYFNWENVAKIWSENLKKWIIEKDARRFNA